MSNIVSRIARAKTYRAGSFHEKGQQIGVTNQKARDLLARLEREKKREAGKRPSGA